MENLLKNPLKVIAAGLFVVAMGFGMSTSLDVSESYGNIDLLAMRSAVAQSEGGSCEACIEQSNAQCNYWWWCNLCGPNGESLQEFGYFVDYENYCM